jgi:hypothetical protein
MALADHDPETEAIVLEAAQAMLLKACLAGVMCLADLTNTVWSKRRRFLTHVVFQEFSDRMSILAAAVTKLLPSHS